MLLSYIRVAGHSFRRHILAGTTAFQRVSVDRDIQSQ